MLTAEAGRHSMFPARVFSKRIRIDHDACEIVYHVVPASFGASLSPKTIATTADATIIAAKAKLAIVKLARVEITPIPITGHSQKDSDEVAGEYSCAARFRCDLIDDLQVAAIAKAGRGPACCRWAIKIAMDASACAATTRATPGIMSASAQSIAARLENRLRSPNADHNHESKLEE
jgi:hypothetical protein